MEGWTSALRRAVKRRLQGFVRSEYFLEIIPGEFAISEDLSKEPTSNRLASVNGYNRAPSIWMAQEMVTAPRSDHLKSKFPKGFDNLGASE